MEQRDLAEPRKLTTLVMAVATADEMAFTAVA